MILTLNNKTVIPQSDIINSCKKTLNLSKVGQRKEAGVFFTDSSVVHLCGRSHVCSLSEPIPSP